MVTTLRQAKAELSRIVKLAGNGENIVITVRGKKVARIVKYAAVSASRDRLRWAEDLKASRKRWKPFAAKKSTEQLLKELRAERE